MIWHSVVFVVVFWLLVLTYFCGALGLYWHGLLDHYERATAPMKKKARRQLRHNAMVWPALTMHAAAKYFATRGINLAKADHEEMMADYTSWRAVAVKVDAEVNAAMGIPNMSGPPKSKAWYDSRQAIHDPDTKELLGYIGYNEPRQEWDIIDRATYDSGWAYQRKTKVQSDIADAPAKKMAPRIPLVKRWG